MYDNDMENNYVVYITILSNEENTIWQAIK